MKINIPKTFYTLLFFIGTSSMLWGYYVYEKTFIDAKILVQIGLVTSILFTILIKKHYSKTYNTSSIFYSFGQSVFSIGFISISAIVLLNFYFNDNNIKTYRYHIKKIGNFTGKSHQPWAIINHQGFTKQIVFKPKTEINIDDKIEIQISKGLFNFEIINEKKIIKN